MSSNRPGTGLIVEKNDLRLTVSHLSQACLLKGKPIVDSIERWCLGHNRSGDGITPTLAVLYFDTGSDARDYLKLKAEVAAKAGIGYTSHKLRPNASIDEVLGKIDQLNKDDRTHGILVQRPIPKHLSQCQVMYSITRQKHVEEYAGGNASNIALDAVKRLLAAYHKVWMLDLDIVILGGTNIITPGFKAELKRRFQFVEMLPKWEGTMIDRKRQTIVMTELNRGGVIKPSMLGPGVKLVIDLGFDVDTKTGDLDPEVYEMNSLMVVPTPGGALPIILWLMMERTIRANCKASVSSVPGKNAPLGSRLVLNQHIVLCAVE